MGCSYSTRQVESQHYATFCDSLPRMDGKTVVITGTTSGTGLVAAKTVATKGATVVMLNRPSERAEAALDTVRKVAGASDAASARVHHVDCDLMEFRSVREAAASVLKLVDSTGIDALVNNAGASTSCCDTPSAVRVAAAQVSPCFSVC